MEQQFVTCKTDGCLCGIIKVPVLSVDGIECEVHLERKADGSITCVLQTSKCGIMDSDDCDEHVYNRYPVTLDTFSTFLSSLRFNKLLNCFERNPAPVFDWSFLESETVKVHDKCCVCYERTGTRTTCKHSLCIPCFDKIDYNDDHETICPMCRTDCYIKPI